MAGTVTINSETVVTAATLEMYEEIGSDTVRDNVASLAEARLAAYVRRAGVTISDLDSTNAEELEPLGVAIWCEAYWAQLAKELDVDEGFESKRAYWERQIAHWREIILDDPPQLTGISADRPRGNLRYVEGAV